MIKNIYISGSIIATGAIAVAITVDGDCQVSGSGLINLQSQFHNLILNGYNNLIPYTGFNGGSFSTVTYNGVFDQYLLQLPYINLKTQNSGKKYQISDITIGGSFNQQSDYECGINNLTVNGSSTIGTVGAFSFSKNGAGNLLFIGNVDFEGSTDFSGGNPDVEFRGGFTIHTFGLTTGTGNFIFTANQTINCSAYIGGSWNAKIIIQGAVVLTLSGGAVLSVNNIITGTSPSSTFNNEGVLYLTNNTTPMATGVFNYQHITSSTLGYVFNGNFSLPYTSYANLVIGGTGVKSQSGNTTIAQSLTIGSLSVNSGYECNGYNLTVNGTFTNSGTFTANSYANILFVGLASFNNGPGGFLDLSTGNPDVEFRGGLTIHANGTNTGSGTFKFSTNNQTIDNNANNGGIWNANILISGAISVTFIEGFPAAQNYVNGTLNGDNVNSIFINKGVFNYANPQQPMQTGKLYCNQAVNTFYYCFTGNQDITAPSDPTPGYQNLVLNTSGAKRLLGNVSVKGTYTLTTPATLNSNGFSLTNP